MSKNGQQYLVTAFLEIVSIPDASRHRSVYVGTAGYINRGHTAGGTGRPEDGGSLRLT